MQRDANLDVLQFKPELPPPYFSAEILKSSIDEIKKADLEEIESLPEAKVVEMQTVQDSSEIQEDANIAITTLEEALSSGSDPDQNDPKEDAKIQDVIKLNDANEQSSNTDEDDENLGKNEPESQNVNAETEVTETEGVVDHTDDETRPALEPVIIIDDKKTDEINTVF